MAAEVYRPEHDPVERAWGDWRALEAEAIRMVEWALTEEQCRSCGWLRMLDEFHFRDCRIPHLGAAVFRLHRGSWFGWEE